MQPTSGRTMSRSYRSGVQQHRWWIGDASAADHHPLIDLTKPEKLDRLIEHATAGLGQHAAAEE